MLLQHLLLSHHGEPQFGAAVLPQCAEAELLSLIDQIDSRMEIYREVLAPLKAGEFSQRVFALDWFGPVIPANGLLRYPIPRSTNPVYDEQSITPAPLSLDNLPVPSALVGFIGPNPSWYANARVPLALAFQYVVAATTAAIAPSKFELSGLTPPLVLMFGTPAHMVLISFAMLLPRIVCVLCVFPRIAVVMSSKVLRLILYTR